MFELIAGIVEAIISLIASVIEAIASLFAGAGEALGAGEAIAVALVYSVELIFWFVLLCVEFVIALILWRKPRRVGKPVFWRPKKLNKNVAEPTE